MERIFQSWEEMTHILNRMTQLADEQVSSKQASMKPGDFFIRQAGDVTVYGEVLDPALPAFENGDYTEEEKMEIRSEGEIYKQPHMQNFRFTRCYSNVDPWISQTGELGDTHVSVMHLSLTKEGFECARTLNWPSLYKLPPEISPHIEILMKI